MLSVEGIDVFYGNIQAIRGVTLEVRDGEMVGLIGPNGAGKTTTLKTISGLLRPKTGSISFDGQELSKTQPQRIVEMGVAQVPEGRGLFPGLSVLENLKMGHFVRRRDGKLKQGLDTVFQHFPQLAERRSQLAGTLSGGEQQMMVMGRAILSRPKLLLVDEPSLGLAPVIVQKLFQILADINKREGMAMLLVEQFVNLALRHTDRSYVLAKGEISLTGQSSELLRNSDLVSASYMGAEAASAAETNGRAKPKKPKKPKKKAAEAKPAARPEPEPEPEPELEDAGDEEEEEIDAAGEEDEEEVEEQEEAVVPTPPRAQSQSSPQAVRPQPIGTPQKVVPEVVSVDRPAVSPPATAAAKRSVKPTAKPGASRRAPVKPKPTPASSPSKTRDRPSKPAVGKVKAAARKVKARQRGREQVEASSKRTKSKSRNKVREVNL